MAMTVEQVINTLNAMIINDEINPEDELRIMLPQHRNDMSYSIKLIVDDAELPHLETDASSSEYFSKYKAD